MKKIPVFLLALFSLNCFAQIGGNSAFEFLNLPTSARSAALGGNNLTLNDNDLNMVNNNPALLSDSMQGAMCLNYLNYISDISLTTFAYAHKVPKTGTLGVTLQYLNYGKFQLTDETGVVNGSFKAQDYALNISWSKPLYGKYLTGGVSLKGIYSSYYQYFSSAIAFDAGLFYTNPKWLFNAAVVLKNVGTQLKPYVEGNREPLPFDAQIGLTKRLKHAPFRVSMVVHNLLTPDLTYSIPEPVDATSLEESQSKKAEILTVSDKVLRHCIFGVEFLPFKNFYLSLGYNHQRRQEMLVETKPFLVGFSFGAGLKISKFKISYSRASYHIAGSTNNFSISTNLNDIVKIKEKPNMPIEQPVY